MILSTAEMARATGGRLLGHAPAGAVCTDTRAVAHGDWFLALAGERFDAHDFLDTAAAAGAAGVIVQRLPPGWSRGALVVQDTLRALQDLASAARDCLDGIPIIGLTGSAGKTTTRTMIAQAIGSLGRIHQTAGNLNNHIGLPMTLLAAPESAAAVVLELGMSAPGEIHRLQAIARPTVRLITNVAAAHLEGAGDLAGVARCKQELFDGARATDTLIVSADDPRVAAMPLPPGARVIRYGASPGCDVRLIRAELEPDRFATRALIQTDAGVVQARLVSPGLHLAHDATAAVAAARALGVAPADIAEGLGGWRPVGMRMRVERRRLAGDTAGTVTVLNDAYNANPLSMRAALDTLAALPGRRRVALLGDMLELGARERQAHRELSAHALSLGLDRIGFAGPRFAAALAGGADGAAVAESAEALRALIIAQLTDGDVLLLKGSRGLRMEQILRDLPIEEG